MWHNVIVQEKQGEPCSLGAHRAAFEYMVLAEWWHHLMVNFSGCIPATVTQDYNFPPWLSHVKIVFIYWHVSIFPFYVLFIDFLAMEDGPPPHSPTQVSSWRFPYNYIVSCIRSIYRTPIISAMWLLGPYEHCTIPLLFFSVWTSLFVFLELVLFFHLLSSLLGHAFPILNTASIAYLQCLSSVIAFCNPITGGLQGDWQRSVSRLY